MALGKMKNLISAAGAVVLVAVLVVPASAAVTFDAETGTGFIGKGDVQLAFGWNNKQLNDNAGGVSFSVTATSETSWDCLNTRNEKIQERSRTETTAGLVAHLTRDNKKQVTGFNLTGYSGTGSSTVVDGPALHSCPNANGTWVLVEGSTETSAGEGTVMVATYNGLSAAL